MSKYESINPYTNQLIKSYPTATQEEIEQALETGEKLYLTWRNQLPATRSKLLHDIANNFQKHRQEMAKIMTLEMGKLYRESLEEVDLCINICNYYADKAPGNVTAHPFRNRFRKCLLSKTIYRYYHGLRAMELPTLSSN